MVEQGQLIHTRWYAQSPDELARALDVSLAEGLREDDAARRLSMHGRNELPEAPPPSPWTILGAQFTSLIVWVLIGAAIVSGLLGEWVDTGAILAIVLLNGFLGFVQEYRAEQSLARVLGQRGLIAMERLMGLVLVAVAVQMFLEGLKLGLQGSAPA